MSSLFIPAMLTALIVWWGFYKPRRGYFGGIIEFFVALFLIPSVWAVYFAVLYFLK